MSVCAADEHPRFSTAKDAQIAAELLNDQNRDEYSAQAHMKDEQPQHKQYGAALSKAGQLIVWCRGYPQIVATFPTEADKEATA